MCLFLLVISSVEKKVVEQMVNNYYKVRKREKIRKNSKLITKPLKNEVYVFKSMNNKQTDKTMYKLDAHIS